MVQAIKRLASSRWTDSWVDEECGDIEEMRDSAEFLGLESFDETESIDTEIEGAYELLLLLSSWISDNIISGKTSGWLSLAETPVGKFILDSEEGGYFAIHWKKGAIDWGKLEEIWDAEDTSSC